LIEFNRQRIKTFEQKMKEADYLFGIESERAELRKLSTLNNVIKVVDQPTLAERANEEKIPIIPSKQEIGQVRDIISEKIGMKHSTFDKARKVWDDFKSGKETAVEQVKKLNTNDTTINRALNEIKQSEQPLQPKILIPPPEGKFKTLIVDPPWEVKKIIRDVRPNQSTFDYQTMTIDEIKAIDLPAFDDAHIYLWTTQKYLPYAFDILKHWGFNYIFTMVWHKSGGFQPMGLPQYNCEFVLFGRRGSLPFTDTKAFNTCFNANRKEHSRKPDEFYDLVRRVSPEPRIDMFSREKRDGFAQWGNETEKFGVI
jgi:N6-adenosine-specific RNA methylase IME4